MGKTLILGGSGFIGANLAEKFINENHEIIIFDKADANLNNLAGVKDKVEIITGDFSDIGVVENIFASYKIDIVVNLISGLIPGSNFDELIDEMNTNFVSSLKLLEVMEQYSVKKLVFFSSGGTVYGANDNIVKHEYDKNNPINYYGWSKLALEKYIELRGKNSNFDYLIVRPSNAYGKYQNTHGRQGIIGVCLGKILENKPIEIWGDGSVIRDYIYVTDLCKCVISLINGDKWNNVYNIGCGYGISINELLDKIKKVVNRDIKIEYKESRKVDIPTLILNIKKLQEAIPCNNFVELEQGIELFWNYLNEQKYD